MNEPKTRRVECERNTVSSEGYIFKLKPTYSGTHRTDWPHSSGDFLKLFFEKLKRIRPELKHYVTFFTKFSYPIFWLKLIKDQKWWTFMFATRKTVTYSLRYYTSLYVLNLPPREMKIWWSVTRINPWRCMLCRFPVPDRCDFTKRIFKDVSSYVDVFLVIEVDPIEHGILISCFDILGTGKIGGSRPNSASLLVLYVYDRYDKCRRNLSAYGGQKYVLNRVA